jgi:hypothetical protein
MRLGTSVKVEIVLSRKFPISNFFLPQDFCGDTSKTRDLSEMPSMARQVFFSLLSLKQVALPSRINDLQAQNLSHSMG